MNIQTLSLLLPEFSKRRQAIRPRLACWAAGLMLGLMQLGACSLPQPVAVGYTEAQVLAARGTPTHRYRVGNEELLEYMTGPAGQHTWMARMGADGKLISFDQVLRDEIFATIQIGSATHEQVLHTIGAPSERTYLPLSQLEVWSYPYRQNDIWDKLMHVHFDRNGIVRRMETAPEFRPGGMNVFGAAPR